MNKKLLRALKKWRADPVLFVESLMKATPDAKQAEVMQAVARGDRHVAVKSGHGVGKSTLLGWIAVWWISTDIGAKVRITAPTSTQLHDTLLPEMKGWIGRMPAEIQDELYHVTSDRIEFKPFPHENFISAVTSRADQPDAMQGVHAKRPLLIGDEASGIPDQVFEASVGVMSSQQACMVLAGNPVRNKGFFYDCFTKPGVAENWTTFTISCIGHPRISEDFVEEQKARYGEESNAFRIRVLGEFPRGDDDAVIPMHLIQSAVDRDVECSGGSVIWGLDVASFGPNATALVKRQSNWVTQPARKWKGLDPMQVVAAVQEEYEITSPNMRPYDITVDTFHNGLAVATRLRELGLPARAINVSELPAMKDRYANLRSELWFKIREWLDPMNARLPDDDDLIADLAMPSYRQTPKGKLFVQGKATRLEDFRGMTRSPDSGDALALTFASAAATASGSTRSRSEPLRRKIKGIV